MRKALFALTLAAAAAVVLGTQAAAAQRDEANLGWPDREFLHEGLRLAWEIESDAENALRYANDRSFRDFVSQVRRQHEDIRKDLQRTADRKRAVVRIPRDFDRGRPYGYGNDRNGVRQYLRDLTGQLEREVQLYRTQLRSGRERDMRDYAADRLRQLDYLLRTSQRVDRDGLFSGRRDLPPYGRDGRSDRYGDLGYGQDYDRDDDWDDHDDRDRSRGRDGWFPNRPPDRRR